MNHTLETKHEYLLPSTNPCSMRARSARLLPSEQLTLEQCFQQESEVKGPTECHFQEQSANGYCVFPSNGSQSISLADCLNMVTEKDMGYLSSGYSMQDALILRIIGRRTRNKDYLN